eukprot:sb/3479765/
MGYGEWKSPITLDVVTSTTEEILQHVVDPVRGDLCWLVKRQAGKYVIRSGDPQTKVNKWVPEGFSSNSSVYEYGHGDFFPLNNTLYFVNNTDQRLYRQTTPDTTPEPVTTGEYGAKVLRYNDGHFCSFINKIIMVREDHRRDAEVPNTVSIVAIDAETGSQTILVEGADFYRGPHTCGDQIVFVSWNHPNMPWDTTTISKGTLVVGEDGTPSVRDISVIREEGSNLQPYLATPDNCLFISDKTGFWNLWSSKDDSGPVHKIDKDMGFPYGWIAGYPGFGVTDEGIVCAAKDSLLLLNPDGTIKTDLSNIVREAGYQFGTFAGVQCFKNRVFVIGLADVTRVTTILRISLTDMSVRAYNESQAPEHLRPYISMQETITIPTTNGMVCYGFYFPPKNPDFDKVETDEKPPLLVKIHGGPSGMVTTNLDYKTQYFTSRGFGVLLLDYRGSNGLGREFRRALYGNWGVYDIDDAIAGAEFLVKSDRVDKNRLAISGGSAGGYTTMAMMTFRNYFHVGVSYFGLCDLRALSSPEAEISHKFESHYTENLIGKLSEQEDLYKERSPILHADKLSGAIGFFQGSVDKICPPHFTIPLYNAAVKNGIPTFYVEYKGEGHGFREAANNQRCLSNEFYFYGKVLGFQPADDTSNPPPIVNLSTKEDVEFLVVHTTVGPPEPRFTGRIRRSPGIENKRCFTPNLYRASRFIGRKTFHPSIPVNRGPTLFYYHKRCAGYVSVRIF